MISPQEAKTRPHRNPGAVSGMSTNYSENVPIFHGRVWRISNRIEAGKNMGADPSANPTLRVAGKGSSNKLQEILAFVGN